jgi:hypothetical protein
MRTFVLSCLFCCHTIVLPCLLSLAPKLEPRQSIRSANGVSEDCGGGMPKSCDNGTMRSECSGPPHKLAFFMQAPYIIIYFRTHRNIFRQSGVENSKRIENANLGKWMVTGRATVFLNMWKDCGIDHSDGADAYRDLVKKCRASAAVCGGESRTLCENDGHCFAVSQFAPTYGHRRTQASFVCNCHRALEGADCSAKQK